MESHDVFGDATKARPKACRKRQGAVDSWPVDEPTHLNCGKYRHHRARALIQPSRVFISDCYN